MMAGAAANSENEVQATEAQKWLAWVVQRGGYIEEFPDELKADRSFMLSAVQLCGHALEFASDKLKADKEVVLAAVKTEAAAISYAAPEIKNDAEVIKAALKASGYVSQIKKTEKTDDLEISTTPGDDEGWRSMLSPERLSRVDAIALANKQQSGSLPPRQESE